MGESGNHAEDLRALDEIAVNLLRLGHGQARWPYLVLIRHGFLLARRRAEPARGIRGCAPRMR